MGLSELEESSVQLDEELLRFMDQLELLEEKRASLNALIEEGWFSISKARYSMGNKQVSSLQYASEIEPRLCVNAQALDNGEVKFSTDKLTQKSADNMKPVEDVGPQETGVRRRNKKMQNKAEESEKTIGEEPLESKKVTKCDHNPQQDPLKWFGILVPQSLKQAQSSFKQVIELAAEIASLQTAVLNTRRELRKNVEQKHHVQKTDSSHSVEKVES